jgi:Calcineurin-like phosphoesterase
MTDRPHIAVLSDIHIGNGAATCWYQPQVHDPYLTAALEWVVAQREAIREVILLGDVFDLWTYEPSVTPPSMQQILAANPVLLGPGGPFAKLVKAMPGRVRILLGNHDLTFGQRDIDELNRSLGGDPSRGETITLVTCPVLVLRSGGPDGTAVAFTHGHHWCMFNAPDPKSPWGTLPIGHLVSRAIAYRVARDLAAGRKRHAAELPQMGNPRGWGKYAAALATLFAHPSADLRKQLVDLLIDFIAGWSGMSKTEPIHLPAGAGVTTLQDGRQHFAGLHQRWLETFEGRLHDADRAAVADLKGEHLSWFAQRVAFQTSSDLVVMGHTHTPARGLKLSPVDYVNSGYACVAIPDRGSNAFTFTLVDVGRATAELKKVVSVAGSATPTVTSISTKEAPALPVIAVGADFSCYVRIRNHSGAALTFSGSPKHTGWWAVPPPQQIPSGARADIWIQDEVGTAGAAAMFSYEGGRTAFSLACPTRSHNTASTTVAGYETRAGDGAWRTGDTAWLGHPLQLRCTVGLPRPAGVTGGPTVAPPAPDTAADELKCNKSPVPGRTPTADQARAAAHADYLSLARTIMTTCKIPAYRGKVLSEAWLIAADGKPLVELETEPIPGAPGGIRLTRPPAHVNAQVFQIIDAQYGPVDYVLVKSNGTTGTPAFGGYLFLPTPGSPNLHLVCFNVVALDDRYAAGCANGHHAEMQIDRWLNEQDPRWRARVNRIQLTNSSRARTGAAGSRFLGYSACGACCHDLNVLLKTTLNGSSLRDPRDPVLGRIAWADLYDGRADCGHPTDRTHVAMLRDGGWKVLGPLPAGLALDHIDPADPSWPPPDHSTR